LVEKDQIHEEKAAKNEQRRTYPVSDCLPNPDEILARTS